MKAGSIQRFELNDFLLLYDVASAVLLCKSISTGKKIWIKKTEENSIIRDVIEAGSLFYIAFGYNDTDGQFCAIGKTDGKTAWTIPGRAFMYRPFGEYIFLVFIDEDGRYFFIKSSSSEGGIIWHHEVDVALSGYGIRNDYITLHYNDGRREVLDAVTGEEIV